MTERLIGGDEPLPVATTATVAVGGGGVIAETGTESVTIEDDQGNRGAAASGGAVQVGVGGDAPLSNAEDRDSNLLRKSADLPLAKVAAHTQKMRETLTSTEASASTQGTNNESSTTGSPSCSTSTATTGAPLVTQASPVKLTQEQISELDDAADQVYYWALAESHFPEHGSVLLECEALETLMLMVTHDRSPVILAGLRPLPSLLRHPLHKKLFQRLPNIVALLLSPMLKFPNKIEIQEGVLQCLCVIAQHNSEEILHSGLMVGAVLAAMAQHGTHVGVQLQGCRFFSVLAPVPRRPFQSGEQEIRDPTPIAIIFAHVGDVLERILAAAGRFATHSDLTSAVVSTLSTLCGYVQNVETLAGTSAITVVSNALTGHMHEPLIVADCITVLAAMCSELVSMQKRSIALLLKKVMSSTSHVPTLTNCVALVHSIVLSYNIQRRTRDNQLFVNRELISAHQSGIEQGKIPEGTPEPVSLESEVIVPPEQVQEWREEEFKIKQFLSTEIVPFIALGLQHFGEDDPVYRSTADDCLRSLTISKW